MSQDDDETSLFDEFCRLSQANLSKFVKIHGKLPYVVRYGMYSPRFSTIALANHFRELGADKATAIQLAKDFNCIHCSIGKPPRYSEISLESDEQLIKHSTKNGTHGALQCTLACINCPLCADLICLAEMASRIEPSLRCKEVANRLRDLGFVRKYRRPYPLYNCLIQYIPSLSSKIFNQEILASVLPKILIPSSCRVVRISVKEYESRLCEHVSHTPPIEQMITPNKFYLPLRVSDGPTEDVPVVVPREKTPEERRRKLLRKLERRMRDTVVYDCNDILIPCFVPETCIRHPKHSRFKVARNKECGVET